MEDSKPPSSQQDKMIQTLQAQIAALQMQVRRPRPITPDVKEFNGKNYHRFCTFIASMEEKFYHDAEALGGDRGCVTYAFSRLTGLAHDRISSHMPSFYAMKDGKKALNVRAAPKVIVGTIPT